VTMYGVWRKFRTGSPQLSAGSEGRSTKTALPRMSSALVINDTLAVNYDCVGTVPAIESPQYSFVAPTLADSSAGDHAVTEFVVTAHTVKPSAFFISFPDSGYSIDNLPPLAPVMAGFWPGPDSSWTIHWQPASEQAHDFMNYVIYRSTVSDFIPDEATKLADVHDTIYVDADVHDGSAYYYAITARDLAGNESAPATVSVLVNTLASGEGLPTECVLLQNYPNPFNPLTIVDYRLSIRGKVRLSVFDLLGREVAVLRDEEMPAGRYSVEWNASGISSGVYLYRLQAGGVVQTRRMVLLR